MGFRNVGTALLLSMLQFSFQLQYNQTVIVKTNGPLFVSFHDNNQDLYSSCTEHVLNIGLKGTSNNLPLKCDLVWY